MRWMPAFHRPRHICLLIAPLLLAALLPIAARATDITIFPQYADTAWVSLDAGYHAVEVVGGGWSPWDYTTCTEPLGCPRTCLTTVTGWVAIYRVVSPDLAAASVDGVWLTPLPEIPPCVGQPVSYFVQSPDNTSYRADNSLVFPSAAHALVDPPNSVFGLGAASLVGFTLTNTQLGDNRGSLTLRVTSGATSIDGAVRSDSWGRVKVLCR